MMRISNRIVAMTLGEIAKAVKSGLADVRIYIDGYQAGRVLTPYVGGAMGGLVTKQKK